MLPKHSPAVALISCGGRTAGTRLAASIPTRLSQNTETLPCNEYGPTHRYRPTALEVFPYGTAWALSEFLNGKVAYSQRVGTE